MIDFRRARVASFRPSRLRFLLPLFAALVFTASSALAQVDVSTGGPPTTYPTLKDAFDAINAGTHTGTITIAITGDTVETAPAVLNASGTGAASYVSILINPSGGAARTISGAIAAGSPLIDLNGADNVTIDGLNSGGNALTISNTTASATSGTSTIRFIGGATNNVVTNSTILGSATMSVATNGATIFFSTDGATANGNDGNTISNSNIGPAGANLPTKGILCNGSTTTTAIGNSGNVVTGNNIFDYFGATVTSAGVAANGGCNGWQITNNRFFQTGTRTWTAGAVHAAIDIANSTATSGAQGFTITGNTIGFADAAGTGTYTLTGSTGKFLGIRFNGITGGTASSIGNNTIASVSMTGVTSSGTSTSSPFTGILVVNGPVNTSGNTIGSQGATGSLVFSTNSTTATDVYGIYNFSVDDWTANSNSIGGISVTNAAASGTYVVFGMRANTTTARVFNATSNNVGGTVANSIQLTSTGASSQVIGMITNNAAANWTSNTVRNLTNNGGTGTTTGASVIGMSSTTSTPSHTISQNTIHSLANTNATAATVVTGIQFTGGAANVVARNLIYGLTSATNSTAAEINGIRVAGGTTVYRNNMIALGAGVANAIGTGVTGGISGINEPLGTDSFFHNSVYVGGTATAGVGPSFAFNSSQTVNTRSFRDNVFFNARGNGGATGKHYIVRVGGTTPNPAGLTINNNVYFASGAGAVFGFFNALDVANLNDWRTAVGQDAASFFLDPQFNDPTAVAPDLHIHPTNLTPVEGNGADVGVADDFDGQARSGLTPVDIGADAGNFSGADLSAPVISFTPLANTAQTTDRTLTATLTDVTGVATGGLAPRIYYRKNAGAYFSQACSLTSGTTTNGTWSCTIVAADMGGVALADVIGYFVIAQDTPGNVGSTPGGVVAIDVNNVITPPTPATYTIVPGYSGTLSVGATEAITSLTNAGGLFELLNAGALTGNLVAQITSDLTTETGTVALNQLAEDGAGGYTLLIKPSGAPRSVVGSFAGALVRLSGADRVRIDGSTAASLAAGAPALPTEAGGDPSLRELTIQNTSTSTSAGVIAVMSGTNGAQNNTLRNLIVLGQDPTTTLLAIGLGGNTLGTTGTDNDGNRVENCAVRRALFGIYSAGAGAANPNTGTVITRNEVSSAIATDRIRRVGILVFNDDGAIITENAVVGISTNESADAIGIGVGTQALDTTTVATGNVTNGLVSRNRISGVASLSTVGFSASGIAVAGGTAGANTISNNMIDGATAPSTSPDIVAGIFVAGVPGSSTRLLANSVALSGDRGSVASQIGSFGIAVTGSDPTVQIRNNAVTNSQTTSGGGVNAKTFAIGLVSTAFANLDSDFNDFFASGPSAAFFRTGGLGAAGTDHPNLAAWQAAVSDDAGSLEVDPLFVSATDLHLTTSSPLLDAGSALAAVTIDFDDDPRPAATPDIGADEIVQADLSITKSNGTTTVVAGGGTTYTIVASNAGAHAVTGATVTDNFPAALVSCSTTCVGAGGGTCTAGPFSGNINDTVNLPAGASATYTSVCSVSGGAAGTIDNTASVSPPGGVTDPEPSDNSATDSDTVVTQADLSITKTDGSATEVPGTPVIYTIVASNAGPSPVTGATVADTFPGTLTGCSTTCVGAGGGTCTPGPFSGNINDSANLPVGAAVTYTSTCTISAAATGSLVNTATVGSSASDPVPANNTATDTDTLVPTADVAITKTDGSETEVAGTPVTYTITVTNAGPSNAASVTVADTFVAALSGCSTTCVGSGGASCAPGPVLGNISDDASIPAGATATYTATCLISASAYGNLVNTATATVGGAATDPVPGNNSSTDTDLLNSIFIDGFETGDTSQWSATQPLAFAVYRRIEIEPGSSDIGFALDLDAIRRGHPLFAGPLAQLVDGSGGILARIVARRSAPGAGIEIRLEVADGAPSGWAAIEASTRTIRIEWAAADRTSLGSIAATFDGLLTHWIEGFAPAAAPRAVELLVELPTPAER